MKKALILTASFGGGHNKAANNIREKLELRGLLKFMDWYIKEQI